MKKGGAPVLAGCVRGLLSATLLRVAVVAALVFAVGFAEVTGADPARAFTAGPFTPPGAMTLAGDVTLDGVSGTTAAGGAAAIGAECVVACIAAAGLGIGWGIGTGARMVWHWAFNSNHTPDASQNGNTVTIGAVTITAAPPGFLDPSTNHWQLPMTQSGGSLSGQLLWIDASGQACSRSSAPFTNPETSQTMPATGPGQVADTMGYTVSTTLCDGPGHPPSSLALGLPDSNYKTRTVAVFHFNVVAPTEHTMRTVVSCQDGGGNVSTVTAVSSAFVDDGTSALPDMPVPQCPSGTVPVSGVTYEDGDPSSATAPGPSVLTVSTPSWWTQYPDCTQVGASCTLIGSPPPDTSTSPAPAPTVDGGCSWGPYSNVPADFCSANPQPAPPSPSTSDTASPTPTVAAPPVDPYPHPEGPSGDGGDCFPHGWSAFNPVEWVYKPIVCALEYVFIPNPTDIQTQVDSAHEQVENSSLGQLTDAFGTFVTAMEPPDNSGGSCDGPAVSIPALHLTDWHPLSACTEPMETVASLVSTCLSLSVYIGLALLGIKSISSSFGIKVHMGGNDEGGVTDP